MDDLRASNFVSSEILDDLCAIISETNSLGIAMAVESLLQRFAPQAKMQFFEVQLLEWAEIVFYDDERNCVPLFSVEESGLQDLDAQAQFEEIDGKWLYSQILQQHGGAVGLLIIDASACSAVEQSHILQQFKPLLAGLGSALGNAAMYTTLEEMVATEMQASVERELEMQLVLDNMNDALVVVDLEGQLEEVRSAKLEEWLGPYDEEARPKIWDYLFANKDEAANFEMGFVEMAADILPFELNKDQAVTRFMRGGRYYAPSYEQVFKDDEFKSIVITISDVTVQVAGEAAEVERQEMFAVLKMFLQDADVFFAFLESTTEDLLALKSIDNDADLKIALHTLKGNTAIFGFKRFASAIHATEDALEEGEAFGAAQWQELDDLWQASTAPFSGLRNAESDEVFKVTQSELQSVFQHDGTLSAVKEILSRWHLPFASGILRSFRTEVARLSRRENKNIRVVVEDNNCRLNPEQEEVLKHSIHLLRNCVDHGFERGEERIAAGKNEQGTLLLRTEETADGLSFSISDDGRGVDWERIREVAKSKGLPFASRDELQDAFFADGLSTCEKITELSGRGVGTAAVARAVKDVGGKIWVESEMGKATVVKIFLPR